MNIKMTHTPIFVLDQDAALDFYVNKLGFEVHTDAMMGPDFRWLTVCSKDAPGFEIILMKVSKEFMKDEESYNMLKTLVEKGKLGAGVFETSDCRATYEELKSKGVEFLSPPEERFYGIECVMKDNSGNWFSLTQPAKK